MCVTDSECVFFPQERILALFLAIHTAIMKLSILSILKLFSVAIRDQVCFPSPTPLILWVSESVSTDFTSTEFSRNLIPADNKNIHNEKLCQYMAGMQFSCLFADSKHAILHIIKRYHTV